MEIQLYFQMLKRGWWIILLTMLVTVIVTLGATYLATPQYQAKARFIVSPSTNLINRADVVSSLDTLNNQTVTATFAGVMNSDRVLANTLASLNYTAQDIKDYTYKASIASNSSVIELVVTGPDANIAAKLANVLGSEAIKFISRLNQVFSIDFLDEAVPPIVQYSPQPFVNLGLAIALGLVFGSLFVILSEQIRLPIEVFKQRRYIDNMTGVYNKRYISRVVESELATKPDGQLSIGIVELIGIIDLVDSLPVSSLQKIFKGVTDILHRELRGNDIIGRWNDNSFVLVLPNTPGSAANRIFERVYHALSESNDFSQFGMVLDLNVRIGGAEYSDQITTQELFNMANNALEHAGQKGDIPVSVLSEDEKIITTVDK